MGMAARYVVGGHSVGAKGLVVRPQDYGPGDGKDCEGG